MTALRVLTDHTELSSIGNLTHPEIDSLISGSLLVTVPGVTGTRTLRHGANVSITVDAHYVTISATGGGGGGSTFSWMEVPDGPVDGMNRDFSLTNEPLPPGSLMLFVNGILMTQGGSSDYVLSGTSVSLAVSPRSGSNLNASYPY